MTSIDRDMKALKEEREHYRVLRDRCILGSVEFFFYVGLIAEVDEKIDQLKERT